MYKLTFYGKAIEPITVSEDDELTFIKDEGDIGTTTAKDAKGLRLFNHLDDSEFFDVSKHDMDMVKLGYYLAMPIVDGKIKVRMPKKKYDLREYFEYGESKASYYINVEEVVKLLLKYTDMNDKKINNAIFCGYMTAIISVNPKSTNGLMSATFESIEQNLDTLFKYIYANKLEYSVIEDNRYNREGDDIKISKMNYDKDTCDCKYTTCMFGCSNSKISNSILNAIIYNDCITSVECNSSFLFINKRDDIMKFISTINVVNSNKMNDLRKLYYFRHCKVRKIEKIA